MKTISMQIIFHQIGGYTFGHIFPETASTFIKIFTDTVRKEDTDENETPPMTFKFDGNSDQCVFTVLLDVEEYDLEKYKVVLERLKYYTKYNYCVKEGVIYEDMQCVYFSETKYV